MEVRTAASEWGSSAIPPPWMGSPSAGWSVATGTRVTTSDAAGLPAVMRAIRIKAETMAAMGLVFYRLNETTGLEEKLDPTQDNWQVELFDGGPAIDYDAYNWLSDMAAGVEGYGNSFALKTIGTGARGRREVVELIPQDPDYCRVKKDRNTGAKLIDIHLNGKTKTYSADQILHFRGFTLNGAHSGLSPAMAHAAAFGHAIALEDFSGRYFSNDTSVGLVLEVPGALTVRQAQRQLAVIEMAKAGSRNAHRPMILYNGMKANRVGLGLHDSQYIEAQNWTVEQVARIFGVPGGLLEVNSKASMGAARLTEEQESLRFLSYGLFHPIRRFEETLKSDPDLRLVRDRVRVRFDIQQMIRVSAKDAADVEHLRIQDGTLMRDEARASRGMGPLPPMPDDPNQEPGKVVPPLPVGAGPAGPNQTDATGTSDSEPGGK